MRKTRLEERIKELEAEAARHETMIGASAEIRKALNADDELMPRLDAVLDILREFYGQNTQLGIMLMDEGGQRLKLMNYRGEHHPSLDGLVVEVGKGISGAAAREKRTINAPDVRSLGWKNIYIGPESTRSEMAIPLIFEEHVYGVLNAERHETDAFTEQDEGMLQMIADSIAPVLANSFWKNSKRYDSMTGVYSSDYIRTLLAYTSGDRPEKATKILESSHIGSLCSSDEIIVGIYDLDYLKTINDSTEDHAIGDQRLTAIAHILRDAVGDKGLVARYGGDEFVVVMFDTNAKEYEGIQATIDKRIKRWNDDYKAKIAEGSEADLLPDLSVSKGYVQISRYNDVTRGLEKADKILYEEKNRRATEVALIEIPGLSDGRYTPEQVYDIEQEIMKSINGDGWAQRFGSLIQVGMVTNPDKIRNKLQGTHGRFRLPDGSQLQEPQYFELIRMKKNGNGHGPNGTSG
ncbi:GGDEF domain-containing protein [Candidatus Woesearchaeota archaeon]|nr:GGDEF domain-containing protein [Candidatus Woesearchaeota archaeon]